MSPIDDRSAADGGLARRAEGALPGPEREFVRIVQERSGTQSG
jgi:hypothetical protein